MNELPENVAAALQEYIKLRSNILALEHEARAYETSGQYELKAKADIRLLYMRELQSEAREHLDTVKGLKRVSSEAIVKALS